MKKAPSSATDIFKGSSSFDKAVSEARRKENVLKLMEKDIEKTRKVSSSHLAAARRLVERDLYDLKISQKRNKQEQIRRQQCPDMRLEDFARKAIRDNSWHKGKDRARLQTPFVDVRPGSGSPSLMQRKLSPASLFTRTQTMHLNPTNDTHTKSFFDSKRTGRRRSKSSVDLPALPGIHGSTSLVEAKHELLPQAERTPVNKPKFTVGTCDNNHNPILGTIETCEDEETVEKISYLKNTGRRRRSYTVS